MSNKSYECNWCARYIPANYINEPDTQWKEYYKNGKKYSLWWFCSLKCKTTFQEKYPHMIIVNSSGRTQSEQIQYDKTSAANVQKNARERWERYVENKKREESTKQESKKQDPKVYDTLVERRIADGVTWLENKIKTLDDKVDNSVKKAESKLDKLIKRLLGK